MPLCAQPVVMCEMRAQPCTLCVECTCIAASNGCGFLSSPAGTKRRGRIMRREVRRRRRLASNPAQTEAPRALPTMRRTLSQGATHKRLATPKDRLELRDRRRECARARMNHALYGLKPRLDRTSSTNAGGILQIWPNFSDNNMCPETAVLAKRKHHNFENC